MTKHLSRNVSHWRHGFRAVLQAKFALAAALALLAASAAWGQGLTYVDADTSSNLTPLAAIDTVAEDDDQWYRRLLGANGTVFESGLEVPPELTQKISSLTPGTSYDVYVVHWTDSTSWTIAGGLAPGEQVVYNRAGPNPFFPTAKASTPAAFAQWSQPSGAPPMYQEGNRVMVLGKLGSKVANPSGEINVYINDPGAGGVTEDNRTWFDGVAYVPTATPNVTLSATIDRTTGILSINNPTATNFQISSVSIQSSAGTLDPAGWTSISSTYDSNSGNPIVDPNDVWNESPGTATNLTEAEVASPTVPNGILAAGTSLSLGAVSKLSFYEDISVVMKLNDIDANASTSDTFRLIASYTNGTAIVAGDLNADGDVDIANDYAALIANLNNGQAAGPNAHERYQAGDLTNNNQVNYFDLLRFREAYDAANGLGAFDAAVNSVPEPTGLALAAIGIGAVAVGAGRRRFAKRAARRSRAVLALIAAACVAASTAPASANPVTGWAIDPTIGIGVPGDIEPALSGAGTASPTIGDGTRNNADSVAFFAPFSQVTLADRQEVTLSGAMTLTGADNPQSNDFRWGLFFEGGTADTLGWSGYMATNASGNEAGSLFSKVPNAASSFVSTGSAAVSLGPSLNVDPFDLFVDGVYNFEMTVGRFGADVSVRGKLTSASGYANLVGPLTDPASAGRLTFDFNRVGFLAGGNLNANQLAFSGIDVTGPTSIAALSLRVTTSGPNAGKTEIVNTVGGGPISMAYYEIASAGGALTVANYTSLDDAEADPFGQGWEESGGNSGLRISETVLDPADAETLAVNNALNLGNAFNGNAQDLVFTYGLPDGTQIRGLVDYVAGSLPGDFNNDTVVDGQDLAQWEGDFGVNDESDADGDQDSDGNDFLIWQRNVGNSNAAPAGAPVPEPASLLLAAIALAPWAVRRRGKGQR